MNIKIPSGIILTLLLASILTLAFNIQVLEANPIPIPSIWMPEEYIDADISLVDGVVQARVNGTYPFAPLGTYYQVMMYYPVPPDADRITVEMNETKLDWTYGNETYPTVFGNWPMIIWDIAPVPEYFEIETYYEHPIPVIDGNYTFLYAMGTGKYLDYYTKETIAYVSVNISKHVADERNLIDVYTIGYNAMTEEWTWNPADYIITEEDETWIVTLTVISEMFHPLIEDLLITIKSEPTTWTVDDDGPADFSSIQEAINAAHSGDTIFVHSGTYYENVVVNKTVSLVGENKSTTAIDGNGTLVSIVDIVANNVVFRGFTIQNDMPVDYLAGGGICINDFDGAIIFDNIVANTQYGINLWNSTGNTIIGNYIKGNDVGIQFQFFSANNTISGNNIANNDYGIRTDWSPDNRFYHNNLMDNNLQVYKGGVLFSPNIWDIGYPLGGNYWDDYSGTDMYSGPHQNETSSDGIGDSAYEVTFSNTIPKISLHDNYPLMGMFHNFNISLDYYVNVISNSTVEDFEYFESNSTIKVYVSNITTDQTHGFCRLTIPHDVVSPPYTVAINDDPLSYTTIFENDTLSIIYLSYGHSTLEIIISPELPPSDTTPPTITILSPENITYPANDVPLTFTASESISWIGYSLDGQANITIAGNTTLKGLSNGMYNLVVYAKDIPGNTGSSNTVYFTIQTTPTDTTPPGISIVSPENKTYYTTDIILTFIVDESVSWMAYSLDGQANVTITGITALTEVSDGSHSLILHARDTAGNTGASEMIHFSTDTQQPEPYISPEPPPERELVPARAREPPFPWHLLITAAIVWIAAVGTILLLVYFAEIKK